MKRRASIELYQDDLSQLLRQGLKDKLSVEDLISRIVRDHENVRRSAVVTNITKAAMIKKSMAANVKMFNRLLDSERQRLGHRSVRQIFKTDRLYSVLCTVSKSAEEFCEVFDLDLFEGFKIYIKLGLKKIGKNYRLIKFITYKDYIFQTYERWLVVDTDSDKKFTRDIISYYLEKVGITSDRQCREIISTYGHDFVYTAEVIKDYETTIQSWVDAQFKGLKLLEVTPEPYHLHTEEAVKRFITHSKSTVDNWRERAKKKLRK